MRACGTCELCCVVLPIRELDKPAGLRCPNLGPSGGCGIYGAHPSGCQTFRCRWLDDKALDDSWRPAVAKFLVRSGNGWRIWVDVDTDYPSAWRDPKYHPTLKSWAQDYFRTQGEVVVRVGAAVIAIFPHEDIELGDVDISDQIAVSYEPVPGGRQPWVRVFRADGEVVEFIGQLAPD